MYIHNIVCIFVLFNFIKFYNSQLLNDNSRYNFLNVGDILKVGDTLIRDDGKIALTIFGDFNLKLFDYNGKDSKILWSSYLKINNDDIESYDNYYLKLNRKDLSVYYKNNLYKKIATFGDTNYGEAKTLMVLYKEFNREWGIGVFDSNKRLLWGRFGKRIQNKLLYINLIPGTFIYGPNDGVGQGKNEKILSNGRDHLIFPNNISIIKNDEYNTTIYSGKDSKISLFSKLGKYQIDFGSNISNCNFNLLVMDPPEYGSENDEENYDIPTQINVQNLFYTAVFQNNSFSLSKTNIFDLINQI